MSICWDLRSLDDAQHFSHFFRGLARGDFRQVHYDGAAQRDGAGQTMTIFGRAQAGRQAGRQAGVPQLSPNFHIADPI